MNKLLVGIAALLVILLGITSFIAWQLWFKESLPTHITQIITPTPTPPIVASTVKKITYVKDNAVWVISADITDKTQLTKSTNAIITNLTWKNSGELSFVRCTLACQIITLNISTNSETIEIEQPRILALDWNKSGTKLVYLYSLPDGQMKLDLKTGNASNVIKNFFAGPGRGGSLDDEVSIHFSPDDKYILVTNTLTVGNPQDKNTIWVIESETGKEVFAIPIGETGWPTQAVWMPNNYTFIYKEGPVLKSVNGLKESNTFVTLGNFYNPTVNHKGGNVADLYYWVNTKSFPYIGSMTGGAGTPQVGYKFIEGYYKPSAAGYDDLVALKAQKTTGEEIILPFVSGGISIIDRNSKQIDDLDLGEINLFAVSP